MKRRTPCNGALVVLGQGGDRPSQPLVDCRERSLKLLFRLIFTSAYLRDALNVLLHFGQLRDARSVTRLFEPAEDSVERHECDVSQPWRISSVVKFNELSYVLDIRFVNKCCSRPISNSSEIMT